MPLISAPTNTRSTFPTTLDSFPVWEDGTGIRSLITATTWNNLETAIYRLEKHTQNALHVVGGVDRTRLKLASDTVVGAPAATVTVTFTLTAAQLAYLGSQPFRATHQILADAYRTDSADTYTCQIQPLEPNQLAVVISCLDPTQTVAAGTYRVRVTFLGV